MWTRLALYATILVPLTTAQICPPDEVDELVKISLPKLWEYLAKHPQANCTPTPPSVGNGKSLHTD